MLLFQKRSGQVFLLHLFIRLTVALEEDFGNFTNPPNNGVVQNYRLGSRLWITWETRLERITLKIMSDDGAEQHLANSQNLTNTGDYDWFVGRVEHYLNQDVQDPNEMDISKKLYFAIFKPGDTTAAFVSNSFTVVSAVSSSTSATTLSSSMLSSSASSSSFITSTSPASLATSSSSMSSSSASISSFILSTSPASSATTSVPPSPTATVTIYALSERAKTGIGVGIGLPLLFALGIYLGWRFRGGQNTPRSSRASIVDTPFIDPQIIDPPSIVAAPNSNWPLELPDSNHPTAHEMSDHASR